jgi:hypothetical protein
VSVLTVQPNHHFAVAYQAPIFGPTNVEVEAEHPISVLIVDPLNLLAWRSGRPTASFAHFQGVRQVKHQMYLPSRMPWNLVIVNTGLAPAAVYYAVQTKE